MKNLINTLKKVSLLILAISFIGCDDDEAVLPQLKAGFTHTINANTGTVTFINTSINASTYEWDFADEENTTSRLINPVNVYENGTYLVVLKSSNVAGAFDIFSDEITISITEFAALPITFDIENITYEATVFDGTSFEILTNPDLSGTNAIESNVGAITNSGATYEGLFFELGAPVDLTAEKSIKMNFWADAPVNVLMKLEEGSAANTETTASHTGSGWEEIIFTFNSAANYSKLTIFVDGAGTTDGTFYFDDITQIPSPAPPCDAETEESLAVSDLNITFMSDPTASIANGGATFEWIDNPDFENDVNTSCKVGQITKLGNNPWDNNQIDLDAKLDFNANEGLKLKVWSSVANTEVRIKLEEIGTPANNVEKFLTTTVTNGWEELSFAFTSADSDKYNKIVIFFDLNANNTDTYYFDDLMLYGEGSGGGGGGNCTTETTESYSAANLNMSFQTDPTVDFINDGSNFSWIDNPDFDNAVNSSCKVGQVVRGNINPWDNNQYDLDAKLDFNANSGLKIKVWSARPNTEVRLKLEEIGNAGNFSEQFLTTSVTSEWEELTFPFAAADSNKFNKIVIFFDLNTTSTDTYYFDDLKLYGNGSGGGGGGGSYNLTLPIDFETTGHGASWTWNVFENGSNPALEFVANPNASGINTSATVAKITALQAGQPYVGTETAHGEMGITWDLTASNDIIKIMVYKTVISDVGIKLVNPAGGAQAEIKVANTVINAWEELTFDFSSRIGNGLDGSTNIDQIVIFPDFNARSSDNVIYFDNITFE